MDGNNISEDINEEVSNGLSELFNEESLDLIINLLAEHYNKLSAKLEDTPNYLIQSKIMSELQIKEAELIRFRETRPYIPDLIGHQDNLSLDDFDL